MTAAAGAVTAGSITEALRRDYIRKPEMPAGVFMAEVGSPDGNRRADALYIPAVGGNGIIGHEIKVSRSDVLAELADPHKAEAWKQYCVRWWLVVAEPGLVEGLEIPDDWGIKCPPTQKNRRQFTVLRPAPKLDPIPLGRALGRIATVWAYRQRDHEWEQRRAQSAHELQGRKVSELEDKLRRAGVVPGRPDPDLQAAVDLLAALRERSRGMFLQGRDIGAIADAIIEANGALNMRRTVASAFDQKRRQINDALKAISTDDWRFKDVLAALKDEGATA